jgi:undecaprenyl-diphosphatase
MSPLEAIVLGTIQGFTEFLPVSSSAHLYLVPRLLGWPYGGMAFDVALHWGTLIALLAAFWGDWLALFRGAFSAPSDERDAARGVLLKIAVACIPAAVIGWIFQDFIATRLRSLPLQAAMLAIFGFLLWWVDRTWPTGREERNPSWRASMTMGLAQTLALVPGVSRSGITITAGRTSGLARVSAARFSFLLATPITFGAGIVELRHMPSGVAPGTLLLGVVTAAVTGFFAIRGLIRWLGRAGFGFFFAYRLALAVLVLIFSTPPVV